MTKYPVKMPHLRQLSVTGKLHESPQQCYPLSNTQESVIGREPNCQVVLNSTQYAGVSRHHAIIRPVAVGTWEICDLKSSNGTYINGQRLQGCQVLKPGDRIVLGYNGVEFVFEIPAKTATTLSLTQLIPIFSTGRDLTRKAYLIPGSITVLFVILMFSTIGNFQAFAFVLAIYIASAAYFFIYQLCGKSKPWWLLMSSALATIGLMLSPVWTIIALVFRGILPGNLFGLPPDAGFWSHFTANFFGAGMAEELLKSIPIFGVYFLGKFFRSPKREKIGVIEPLDGILIGTAAAVGFTLTETLVQYVPNLVQEAGELAGLQLLIPRILGSVSGHLAYSGYLGYFIGLSALKPRKTWIILPVGYLTASALHGFWNATASIPYGLLISAIVGIISYAFLTAAILKARALSPTRTHNFATQFKQL